jgi:hypothetical protein
MYNKMRSELSEVEYGCTSSALRVHSVQNTVTRDSVVLTFVPISVTLKCLLIPAGTGAQQGPACFYTQPNCLPTRNTVTVGITRRKLNNQKMSCALSLPRPGASASLSPQFCTPPPLMNTGTVHRAVPNHDDIKKVTVSCPSV